MFVFWYCHKRGKEVRLAKEAEGSVDGGGEVLGEEEDEVDEDVTDVEGEDAGVEEEMDEEAAKLEREIEEKADALGQPTPAEVALPETAEVESHAEDEKKTT